MKTRQHSHGPLETVNVLDDELVTTFEEEVSNAELSNVNNSDVGLTNCHDDDEIDALVNKTLQKFSTSKFHSKAKACSALHNRLISAGKLRETRIQTEKGKVEKQNWKTGEKGCTC